MTAIQKPEAVRAALTVYGAARSEETGADETRQEIAAIDRALQGLKAEEACTVQAQIAGIAAGASPDAYAGAFTHLAIRRKDLLERRGALRKSLQHATHPQEIAPRPDQGFPQDFERVLADVETALTSPDVADADKRGLIGRVVEQVCCRGLNDPYPGGVDVIFLPGLFGEIGAKSGQDDEVGPGDEGGILIVQPTTMERKVSQPSAKTRITWGMTKAANTQVSQKCQTRA